MLFAGAFRGFGQCRAYRCCSHLFGVTAVTCVPSIEHAISIYIRTYRVPVPGTRYHSKKMRIVKRCLLCHRTKGGGTKAASEGGKQATGKTRKDPATSDGRNIIARKARDARQASLSRGTGRLADRQTKQASSMALSVGTDGDKRRAMPAATTAATLTATAVRTVGASDGGVVAAGGRGTSRSAAHWRKIRSAVTALAAFRRRKVREDCEYLVDGRSERCKAAMQSVAAAAARTPLSLRASVVAVVDVHS